MAATTANRGYTYPQSTDDFRPYEDIQELAQDVDVDVDAIEARVTTLEAPPLGRIVATGTQSLADNTQTAIAFSDTDDIDTHNFHNPASNNTRVTPTVAGYYRFYGSFWAASMTSPTSIDVNFRKNGSTNLAPGPRRAGGGAASWISSSIECSCLVSMNGTTDYIELVGRQDSSGAVNTAQSLQFSSVIEWEYKRPL
jgi:hypothetical protein